MKFWKVLAWIGLGILAVLAGWLWYHSRGPLVKYGPPPMQVVYGPPSASSPKSTAPPSAPDSKAAEPGSTGGGAGK